MLGADYAIGCWVLGLPLSHRLMGWVVFRRCGGASGARNTGGADGERRSCVRWSSRCRGVLWTRGCPVVGPRGRLWGSSEVFREVRMGYRLELLHWEQVELGIEEMRHESTVGNMALEHGVMLRVALQ